MGQSLPANPNNYSEEDILKGLEKGSKGVVLTIKEMHDDNILEQLDEKTKQELHLIMEDSNEILQHVSEMEKTHHIDRSILEDIKNEEEMEQLLQDIKNRVGHHKWEMALETNLKQLNTAKEALELRG